MVTQGGGLIGLSHSAEPWMPKEVVNLVRKKKEADVRFKMDEYKAIGTNSSRQLEGSKWAMKCHW